MARLNEPPQPATESVDALKRRFVRQNREIAKANSSQSLRIRTLEGEVSRLLAENVSLREQIIKLHYEVEENTSKPDPRRIDSFKTKLEAKLNEVGDLVRELGEVQQDAKKRGPQKRNSMGSKTSPKRSPNQRLWKNTQTLSDLMGDADGRLPPILEDKQFPRQTLKPDELLSLSADPANLTDSPDLGPPPVAHFEEGDPINFDGRGSRRASRSITLSTDPRDPLLPANLETRRRRRESTHSKDTASRDVDAGPDKLLNTTTAIEAPSQPLKAGAKRKWNGKDEGEHPSKELEKDHFQFSRKEATASVGEKFSRSAAQKLSERPPSRTDRVREASKESSTAITSSSRRALGPKSANTDPQSPAKLKNAKTSNEPIATKENLAQKIRDRSQQKEKPRTKTPLEAARLIVEPTRVKEPDALASHEPETPAPAGLDLLSPTSTEPSARQEGRGDTPPPPDLGPGTGTGSFGRASRRPRGSISYAEPNLRDKMRRPTKELVDAVGAEERARQARAIKMDGIESALANIKLEDGTEPVANWQNVAFGDSQAQKERQRAENASPLGKKAPAPPSDLPSSVITNRRRRPSVLPRTDDDSSEPANSTTSGAASTIAALAKPRRRHDQTDSVDKSQQAVGQVCSDRTSIFDFTGSSPDASGKSLENKEEASRTSRSARRHSSVPALSDHGKGSLAISRRIRRESMA